MIVRELLTKWGFEVDDAALSRMELGINGIIKLSAIGAAAIAGMGAAVGFFAKKAGEYEQSAMAFETMLGSAEAAKKMLSEMSDFAGKTPFSLQDVQDNGKQLLAMGVGADDIIPTLKSLGDVAAGVGVPLQRLAWNYGQVRNAGKLTGRDLRDFISANVPLTEYLGKVLKKSTSEVQNLVSAGKVSFADVQAAFQMMSGEGGRYFDLMFKQSASLGGMMSNIGDSWDRIAVAVGQQYLPEIKEAAKAVMLWLDANRKLIALRLGNLMKTLFVYLREVAYGIFKVVRFVFELTDTFIGLERVLKIVLAMFSILFGAGLLWSIGAIVQGVFSIVKAMSVLGRATMLLNVKALAIPLLIGAAIAALFLIFEDFWAFLQGRNSMTGMLLEKLFGKEKMESIRSTISTVAKAIADVFSFLFDIAKSEGAAAFSEMFDYMGVVMEDLGRILMEMINSMQDILSLFGLDGINTFTEFAKIIGGTMISTAIDVLVFALKLLYATFLSVYEVISFVMKVSRALRDVFYGMTEYITKGLATMIQGLRSVMDFLLNNKAGQWIMSKFGLSFAGVDGGLASVQGGLEAVSNFMHDRRMAGKTEAAQQGAASGGGSTSFATGPISVVVPDRATLRPADVGEATGQSVGDALWQTQLGFTSAAYGVTP